MAAQRDILENGSSARREILDAPQDDLALTLGDAAALTFGDLDDNDGLATASRDSLVASSAATRETLVG